MNSKVLLISAIVMTLGLVGCATAKQAAQDFQTGKVSSTPLEEGEVAPTEQAQNLVDMLAPIPYVGTFAPIALPFLAGFFTWRRGRRIRKNMPVSTNPITGAFGPKIGLGSLNLENLIQVVTDVFKGAYEVGTDGSGVKRGWKTALSIGAGLLVGSLTIPGVKDWVLANGNMVAVITALSALFSGIEKKLQDVKPVALPPAPPSA